MLRTPDAHRTDTATPHIRRAGTLALITAVLAMLMILPFATPAFAALSGPAYPPPGGVTLGTASPDPTAMGRAGGQTWTFTNFDPAQAWSHLYWGAWDGDPPRIGLDGTSGSALSFSGSQSNLAGGVARWTGTTVIRVAQGGGYINQTLQARFTLTSLTTGGAPLALVSAASAGVPSGVGAVVDAVSLSGYKANFLFEVSDNGGATWTPAITYYDSKNTDPTKQSQLSFHAGFYYNRYPTATPQVLSTNEDTDLAITLDGMDPDGNALTATVVTGPANGTLSGSAPNLTYTPNANYNGSDSFTFIVNDGLVDSQNTATIDITVISVNDPPVADDQSVSTDEDTALDITLTGNDPVEGDPVTFVVVGLPSNGVLTGVAPNVNYAPNPDFNGSDSFTFLVDDGMDPSNLATVSITVNPVNDAPIADDQSVSTDEDTDLVITLTGSDVDVGDTLTFSVVDGPTNGTLSGTAPNLTYTPNGNFNGADSLTFQINDETVDSNLATISITVNAVNDIPVADDQSVSTDEDVPLAITLTGTDVEGDPLTFEIVDGPTNGGLSGAAPALTYTPNANYNGPDSFTFKITDDGGLTYSNVATVSITVNAVNDAPDAVDDAASTEQFVPVTIAVLANDTDVEGNTISITAVGAPGKGAAVDNGDGTITYTPNATFKGSDSFTYTVSDGNGGTDTATVTITEIGCGEDGLEHLKTTPAEGVASGVIDQTVEPDVGMVDEGLAATVHETNCDTVVPTEDAIDGMLP